MQRAPQEIYRELQNHRLNRRGLKAEESKEIAQIDEIKEQEAVHQKAKK